MTDNQIESICDAVKFTCFIIGAVIALYICEKGTHE